MTSTLTQPISRVTPDGRCQVLLKLADLQSLPNTLSGMSVSWELHDGVPVPMSPPGYRHGRIALRITGELYLQGEKAGYGEAGEEIGVVLRHNPAHVVGVDGLFITKSSLPVKMSPEGYLATIPELVLEVRSKNDTPTEVVAKVDDYLAAGVTVVWVADPTSRSITAYRASQEPQVFATGDELTVPDIIPPFRVSVDTLFPPV